MTVREHSEELDHGSVESNGAKQATIETRNLRKYFEQSTGWMAKLKGQGNHIKAVDDVSIRIEPGEVFGLVGESGSGKSTLGETILRLQEPTDGEILYDGDRVDQYSKSRLREFRKDAQLIFQDPYECLNPKQTVEKIVGTPLRNFESLTRDELRDRICTTLDEVGLRPPETYLDTFPDQLSGGQRQRVNIARALVIEPNFIVADEPVSMLDISIQASLLRLLSELQEKIGFSMLFISHNLAIVQLISDRIGVMYKGRIVEEGRADQVFRDPKHPYTQLLVSSVPDPDTQRERVEVDETGEHIDYWDLQGCRFAPHCPERFDPCEDCAPALASIEDRDVACYLHHDEAIENSANR